MTNITLNFEDTFEGGIQDGVYEVIITTMQEDATQSGTEYTDVRLTVRNDVDQKYKNQIIFHKIWKAKATGKYNMRNFNTLGAAIQEQLKNTSFNTLEELFQEFRGKALRVQVKNETSEYNGKTYENLNVKQMGKTQFPDIQHQFKDGQNPNESNPFATGGAEVNDDSTLPF